MGNTNEKPIVKPGRLLSEMKPQMRPFDALLFKGSDFVSGAISVFEKRGHVNAKGGNFTHAGIIVTDEIFANPLLQPGKLYVLESVIGGKLGCGIKDINGKAFLGVQIRDLDELLLAYDKPNSTSVAWCPLINNPCVPGNVGNIRERFTQFCNGVYGIMWDANCWSLLSSLYPKLRPMRPMIEKALHTENWLFCSELVATIYRNFGVYPQTINPKDVVPADIAYPEEDTDRTPKIVREIIYLTSPIHSQQPAAPSSSSSLV
jgi:hypothetical protein